MVMTRKVGAAMAAQLTRVNESPERLLERIREMQVEIDRLHEQIERQRRTIAEFRHIPDADEPDVQKVLQVSGRPVGNQSALARALRVGADRVSKWHKDRRLQVHIDAAGIEWFFLDQGRPPRKKRGQPI